MSVHRPPRSRELTEASEVSAVITTLPVGASVEVELGGFAVSLDRQFNRATVEGAGGVALETNQTRVTVTLFPVLKAVQVSPRR